MELGYIYLLTCNTNKVYVGSCKNVKKRFCNHKWDYKQYKNNKKNIANSYLLFIDGDVKIHILEEFKYKEKNELLEREKYWIQNYKNISNLECINKIINVVMSKEEYKQYSKEYRENNKDKYNNYFKDYFKKYRQNNQDYIKQYNKKYRENNKDYYNQYSKEYYQKNKEKINVKTTCNICNIEILKKHLNKHNKSKKHINNLNNKI